MNHPRCELVHHIPGRLRLKLKGLNQGLFHLEAELLTWPGIVGVRTNAAAHALIVDYYPDHWQLETLLAEITQLLDQLAVTKDEEFLEVAADYFPLSVGMLGLSVLAVPLEIPVLLLGVGLTITALPFITEALRGLAQRERIQVELLDSLWMGLHTLRGELVAPALLMVGADTLGRYKYHLKALDERNLKTQAQATVVQTAEQLLPPTLLGSSLIWLATGSLAAGLPPLQLDFATPLRVVLPLAVHQGLVQTGLPDGATLETLAQLRHITVEPALARDSLVQALNQRGVGVTVAYAPLAPGAWLRTEGQDWKLTLASGQTIYLQPEQLLLTLDCAQATLNRLYQAIAIVTIPNLAVVAAGLFWGLHPIQAVSINTLATLLALAHCGLLLPESPPEIAPATVTVPALELPR
ncbi:cation transport ATPase-like protein [Gloeomargarita lithophora Alchichica-D10]|uniref:Cation transport ATPase-like protein n=1 Tax=Gloeomargarita lithophora Alchichica-D10 TaxID=1188229 RepID=A0A1J0AA75_9CYAN|nr:hypothetical protein [Gloeomargarita lithophora]APB32834.1 cation transport ATPase-like protein [Gloeomargarita lithophora Alchichica-D10]